MSSYRTGQVFEVTDAHAMGHHFAPGTRVTVQRVSRLGDGSVNALLVRGKGKLGTIVQWVAEADLRKVES